MHVDGIGLLGLHALPFIYECWHLHLVKGKKKRGMNPALSNLKIRTLRGASFILRWEEERGEIHQSQEGQEAYSCKSASMEDYFASIGPGLEEPTAKRPPSKKKKKTGSKGKMVYK